MTDTQLKSGLEENLFDVMRITDFFVLLATAVLAYYMRQGHLDLSLAYVGIIWLGIATFFVAAQMMDVYKYRYFHSILPQIFRLAVSIISSILVCVLLLFMMKISGDFSRLWMGYWLLLNLAGLSIVHLLFLNWFKRQLAKGLFVRKTVLVGQTHRAAELLTQINDPKRTNVTVLAVYSPKGMEVKQKLDLPVIPSLKKLIDFAATEDVDDIIITNDLEVNDTTAKLLDDLRSMPCHVRYCLPLMLFGRGFTDHIWGGPIIPVYRRPLEGRQVRLKRTLDVVVAGGALLALSPVLLGIVLALRLTGQKDVLFEQERHGLAGQTFSVLKFRSMRVADKGTGEVKQATKGDPRITKVGAFLRKTSLDELPQLINVLRGDMSLVGPRPHAVSHNDYYADLIDSYLARNRMKPGITGWAQVNGWRGETDTLDKMEKRVAFDLFYIEHWSLWLDLKILVMTPLTLFSKNAY